MRSRRLSFLLAGSMLVSTVAVLACNPPTSASPAPETPDTMAASESPSESGPSTPDMAPAPTEPGEESNSAGSPPSGDVALPPPSASAWNMGQSDGKPGKADRGVKDYQRIIQENREKFRACYDAALAKHAGIKGRVTLVWVLDPKGAVMKGAHVEAASSDIEDTFLEGCLVSKLKTLTFPPSRRGKESTVHYPFNFNPHSQPHR